MFRFFSPNDSNATNGNGFSGGLRSIRGRAGVVVASTGTLIPDDCWGAHPGSRAIDTSGDPSGRYAGGSRLSDAQDSYGGHSNGPEPRSGWTNEPLSTTDSSGANAGSKRDVGRGRRAAAAAVSVAYNRVQELASQQAGSNGAETPKTDKCPQSASATKVEVDRENAITQDISQGGGVAARKEPIRVQPRRLFPKNPSVTVPIDRFSRFPLRTGTDPAFISSTICEERPLPLRMPSMHGDEIGFPRAAKAPLQVTLYSGSRKLPSTASTFFILAVGIAYDNLKDPHHDLGILETLFKGHESEGTRFKGISGEEATLDAIEEAMGELYREALKTSGSNMLVLLTGDGDEKNRMHLMGDVVITDQDLRRWMWKLQIDCHPNNRTVTIILDYCRTNPDIQLPLGVTHVGVEFIWSCSPGQVAAGLRFPSTQNVPRSCFLLAVMMASYSARNQRDLDLIVAINYELHRLLRLLELTHKKIHEAGRCTPCSEGKPCPMPLLRTQDPDWQQAGSMKSVYDIVGALSKMDIVSEVYDLFMGNRFFCEANELPVDGVTFKSATSHQSGMTQHQRGSSKPVCAAQATQTKC
ncbi:unnamed protein product [Rhizoctonia solani]|uniref:Uncharacterized protein n=1 Tax=Rhizoctonia solani TaxID=456999 RepID=A0A8H3D2H8_9AGAM|nr:unnamed protein product [Rhizoctonia solani]